MPIPRCFNLRKQSKEEGSKTMEQQRELIKFLVRNVKIKSIERQILENGLFTGRDYLEFKSSLDKKELAKFLFSTIVNRGIPELAKLRNILKEIKNSAAADRIEEYIKRVELTTTSALGVEPLSSRGADALTHSPSSPAIESLTRYSSTATPTSLPHSSSSPGVLAQLLPLSSREAIPHPTSTLGAESPSSGAVSLPDSPYCSGTESLQQSPSSGGLSLPPSSFSGAESLQQSSSSGAQSYSPSSIGASALLQSPSSIGTERFPRSASSLGAGSFSTSPDSAGIWSELSSPGEVFTVNPELDSRGSKVWNEPTYQSQAPLAQISELNLEDGDEDFDEDESDESSETDSQELKLLPEVILKVKVKLSDQYMGPPSKMNVYPMHSKPRGNCLIINIEKFSGVPNVYPNREGSRIDEQNLDDLFSQLGFKVTIHRDLTRNKLQRVVREFTEDEVHKGCDMLVVCILSHGKENNIIISSDEKEVDIENEIFKQFNNEFCESLRNKPKLFIVQACRGGEEEFGVLMTDGTDATDAVPITAKKKRKTSEDPKKFKRDVSWSDMLICNATLPGYVALRDTESGTWFIQSICQVFMELAADTDIRDMMDQVGETLRLYASQRGHKETCSVETRLFTKKLYFNPGIYVDEREIWKYTSHLPVKGRRHAISESEYDIENLTNHPQQPVDSSPFLFRKDSMKKKKKNNIFFP